MAAVKENNLVFAILNFEDGAPGLMIGIPAQAWEHMKDGKTHTLDLTNLGIPMKFILYGAADHAAALKTIYEAAAKNNIPLEDARRIDFSIPGTRDDG